MSPASSGTLEIERYIGAYLISQNRSQLANISINKSIAGRGQYFWREHYNPADIYHGNYVNIDGRFRIQRCNSVEGWAGGMPLISFASHQRRIKRVEYSVRSSSSRTEDQHNPLARLAVHTQGAPLIVTKPYNSKKNTLLKNTPTATVSENVSHKKNVRSSSKCQDGQNSVGVVDAVSVASDESSGWSGSSENCLPRIIKPRKRRKKDRKPLLGRPLSQDQFLTGSASPDVELSANLVSFIPYVPFKFDTYPQRSVPDSLPFKNSPIDRLHILGDISEIPKLHHSFEEVEDIDDGKDINGNQSTITCQCRYCDPAGQIWDVDRNCYSPFLTVPNHDEIFSFPKVTLDCLLSSSVSQPNCLIHSMSSISLEDDTSKKKIESDYKSLSSTTRCPNDLEVSTEIVTSLNGHRDLEIRFFSASSVENVRTTKDAKSANDN